MKKIISLFALIAFLSFIPAPVVRAQTDPGLPVDASGNPYTQTAIDAVNTASQGGVQAAVTNTASKSVSSGFTALAPIPGLTDISPTSVVNSDSLANFFNNLYKYLIGLAAVLAIIEIIWGGIEISTQDSVSKKSDGKERITQAILGLILILAPVLVFSIINPSILNLSLNLPKLDTLTTPSIPVVKPLPPCGNGLRTNCTNLPPTQMGNYPTPTPGLFCFERTNPGAANDFVCVSTQKACDTLFNDNMQFGDKSAVGSCRKY